MAKRAFNPKMFNIPTTQLILGAMRGGKPTFMALAWATRVNYQPPLFAIGVNRGHATHEAILESETFSLSIPSTSMVALTDYTGLVSARRTDKSDLFSCFYGELKTAPMIEECPLSMAFRLHSRMELPSNTIFIGELVEGWCEEQFLDGGKPDMTGIKPFFLSMPDNRFFALGKKVGDAWSSGKVLKRS